MTSQFSDFLYAYGTLADTNDTYDVYLYNEDGNILVYATGLSAPNGQIALSWDLTDGNGNQISFGNIQAVFYLHAPETPGAHPFDSPSPAPIHHWFIKDVGGSIDNNVFSVAWGWDGLYSYSPPFADYRAECMQDAVVKFSFMVDHYVAVLKVTDSAVIVGDPLNGLETISRDEFREQWRFCGIVLQRENSSSQL